MSINLEINKKLLDTSEINSLRLHYIPATAAADANGPCNVETMFENYTVQENGYLTNALRGYPLVGNTFKLPECFTGMVFDEKSKSLDESSERTWKSLGAFNQFLTWNYDKIPSKEDPLEKAMDIIDISQLLCQDISEQMLEEQAREYDARILELSNGTNVKKNDEVDS